MKNLMQELLQSGGTVTEGLQKSEKGVMSPIAKKAFDVYEKVHGSQPSVMFRSAMGHILENFAMWAKQNEQVLQSDMPYLKDYGFELITALMPTLIANDLFQTHPAKFKNYSIFYQDYVYKTAKNQIASGTNAITSLTADDLDANYTKDAETNKVMATGNGALATFTIGAGVFSVPMVASSIAITTVNTGDVAMAAVDDGSGSLTGDVVTGSVNYTTGALSIQFTSAVKNNTPVYISYQFVGEGSKENAAEYGLVIRELTGQATERRLRGSYSIESQFSYMQQFNRSMDADLLAGMIGEIRREIDQTLNKLGYTTAASGSAAGAVSWDRTPPTGVQYHYWRETFIDTINEMGNLVIKATGIGDVNRVVGGINFKSVMETLPGDRFMRATQTSDIKGARYIGTLDGTRRCYYEPALGDNEFYGTYKSANPLEPSLVYSPWMPLYASKPHMLDDGALHRYLVTSSGQKVVNAKMFVKGTLTKS